MYATISVNKTQDSVTSSLRSPAFIPASGAAAYRAPFAIDAAFVYIPSNADPLTRSTRLAKKPNAVHTLPVGSSADAGPGETRSIAEDVHAERPFGYVRSHPRRHPTGTGKFCGKLIRNQMHAAFGCIPRPGLRLSIRRGY